MSYYEGLDLTILVVVADTTQKNTFECNNIIENRFLMISDNTHILKRERMAKTDGFFNFVKDPFARSPQHCTKQTWSLSFVKKVDV